MNEKLKFINKSHTSGLSGPVKKNVISPDNYYNSLILMTTRHEMFFDSIIQVHYKKIAQCSILRSHANIM